MKRVKLSNRLQALTDLIDNGASVADIGTDHGYLPAYLVQNKFVNRIFASDISAASLNKARQTAKEYDVISEITFIHAPGLSGVSLNDIDTVIIAGIGGETISSILNDAAPAGIPEKKLLLQPQSKAGLLFRFLYDNSYDIKTIRYVKDKGKRYIVIQADGQR